MTPNPTLLAGLTSTDFETYQQTRDRVVAMGSRAALPLVEQALAQLAHRPSLRFHRPEGMLVRSPGASTEAYNQIIRLADNGKLLDDPAHTQQLIVMVGQRLNGELMEELGLYHPRALQIYQLLGLQMQLSVMAG